MKKSAILTGALLVVMAGAAFANGVNLSWDGCGAAGAANKAATCAAGGANVKMVGSFNMDTPGAGPTGTTSKINIQVDAATMPTFWAIGSSTNSLGTRFPVMTADAVGACPTWKPATEVLDNINARTQTGTSIQLKVAPLIGFFGDPINPGVEAIAFTLEMSTTDAAAGCTTPACFTLAECVVEDAFNNISETITAPIARSSIAWQGGGTLNCPGVVPTLKKTWGSIKALYR